jgi:DEAD/DEAH box helicase domain-containing protein
MRTVVFDIETSNWVTETGSNDPADLSIALVGIHDSETDRYESFLEPELPRLWAVLERTDLLVGYNSDHFDVPLLNKYYPGELSRIRSLDLMKEVQNVLGRRLKLDSLAEATLGMKKIGDGMQSLRWWRAGDVERVREYCLKDVEITKKIYDHALKHGSLKYKDFGKISEVKLDTSKWQTGNGSPMTFTRGF